MSNSEYRTTPQQIDTMPPGIPYIIGNEAAERFSYYGMGAVLYEFLTEHLQDASGALAPMSPEMAKAWQHYFYAAVYALPLLGAILSDWLFGKYKTILWISLIYCIGHGVLALVDFPQTTGIEPKWMIAAGLVLLAIGAGGIKPCVSAHVGDQFGERNKDLINKVFGWFYFSINAGAVVSTLLCPWLLKHYGPGWAFGIPGIIMAAATLVFWLGRFKYVHIPAGGSKFVEETFSSDGIRAVVNLIPLYLFIFPFFMLFDQTHTAWVEQAKNMNGDFGLFTMLPAQLQAVNPALILCFIPLFAYGLYPLMGRWFEPTPLRKIGIGLFLTAASFAIIALAEQRIVEGQKPHMLWQILAYVVITAGEVMVSVTALEFSYTQAPKKMKSFIMGVYLLVAIALGNILTAKVNEYIDAQKKLGVSILDGANYYWFFAAVMLASAIVYVVWSQFYRGRVYIQGDESSPAAE